MFIRYRPVSAHDLTECRNCLRDGFAYDETLGRSLVDMWRELLSSGAAAGAVMEDLTGKAGKRIVWFCLNVFVPEDFALFLRTAAAPVVGLQVLQGWQKGRCPLLTLPQIRRANSRDGVTILVMHAGCPPHLKRHPGLGRIADRIPDFSYQLTAGYRCKELLIETYDGYSAQWAVGAGFRQRTDYAKHYAAHGPPGGPHGRQISRLYGATASEARKSAGTLASMIFQYRKPQFFFRQGEQELLQLALDGETDQELADRLGIALVTVRKRWESIYSRVDNVAPEILSVLAMAPAARRGVEKKRPVLNYLRHHLEELRPLEPA